MSLCNSGTLKTSIRNLMRSETQPVGLQVEQQWRNTVGRTTYNGGVLISLLQKAPGNTRESVVAVAIIHT